MSTAFLVLTIMVAHLGTATLAAQRIAMSALSFCYLPGNRLRHRRDSAGGAEHRRAPSTRWRGGREDRDDLVGRPDGISMVLLFIFATPVMRSVHDDPEVIRIGASALLVIALMLPMDAVAIVLSGALRGTGDTRFPLIIGTTCGVGVAGLAALTY